MNKFYLFDVDIDQSEKVYKNYTRVMIINTLVFDIDNGKNYVIFEND